MPCACRAHWRPTAAQPAAVPGGLRPDGACCPLSLCPSGLDPFAAPFFSPHAPGVERNPAPVDAPLLAQLVQQFPLQLLEYPCSTPASQSPPARCPTAPEHLGWQVAPGNARLEHEDDAPQARSIVPDWTASASLASVSWQERSYPLPQPVWNQFALHTRDDGHCTGRWHPPDFQGSFMKRAQEAGHVTCFFWSIFKTRS